MKMLRCFCLDQRKTNYLTYKLISHPYSKSLDKTLLKNYKPIENM